MLLRNCSFVFIILLWREFAIGWHATVAQDRCSVKLCFKHSSKRLKLIAWLFSFSEETISTFALTTLLNTSSCSYFYAITYVRSWMAAAENNQLYSVLNVLQHACLEMIKCLDHGQVIVSICQSQPWLKYNVGLFSAIVSGWMLQTNKIPVSRNCFVITIRYDEVRLLEIISVSLKLFSNVLFPLCVNSEMLSLTRRRKWSSSGALNIVYFSCI